MEELKRKFKTLWKVFLFVMIFMSLHINLSNGAEDPAKFPSKQITMICQWAAGGNTDITGRKLSELAGKILGQPIVVINKVGGAGVVGVTAAANAEPDGYTIGTANPSPFVVAPHLREVPYNTKKDFTWIMQYAESPQSFGVLTESRWRTFKDFIEEARKNPGKLTYASSGPLSTQHVYIEQITKLDKVKLTHVPVAGGAEVVTKLLGGHLDAGIGSELFPHLKSGGVRGLAVYAEQRLKQFQHLPTFLELGYKINPITWMGLYAPKGIDPRIFKKLCEAFYKAYEDPSFKELLASIFLAPIFLDSESFTAKVHRDYDDNAKIFKEFK